MDKRIQPSLEERGEPDLVIAGLSIWIGGYQYPNSTDEWDGNWILTAALCISPKSSVFAEGPFLTTVDIEGLRSGCGKLIRGEAKSARFEPMEPTLKFRIDSSDQLGHFNVRINITPDNICEAHFFAFEIDQSYLQPIINQCESILNKYPMRGGKARGAV